MNAFLINFTNLIGLKDCCFMNEEVNKKAAELLEYTNNYNYKNYSTKILPLFRSIKPELNDLLVEWDM